jgi:hypothetical protein
MNAPVRAARLCQSALGAWIGSSILLGSGCATYADTIERGQRYYEDNQYERALALWRDLDRRDARLAPAERARFAYFRGMTDYRLGYRDEARHWLAVAREVELRAPGVLSTEWLERLEMALVDLDRNIAGSGPTQADVVQTILAPADAIAPDHPSAAPNGQEGTQGVRPAEEVAPVLRGEPVPSGPGADLPAPALPPPQRRW